MKKFVIVFFACLILFPIGLIAQTTYWEENFTPPPTGWSLDANWLFTSGTLRLGWSPTITNYDLSAVSSVISLPDNVGDLVVTQFIDSYSPVNEIMAIGIIIDGTPQELWQYELIGGNWGTAGGQDITLSLSEYAGEDIQLEFRSYGASTYNFDYWHIYNVVITALFDNDLSAMEVTGPTFIEQNQEDTWSVIVKNTGLIAQDNYTVKLFKHGDLEIGSIQSTVSLQAFETASFDFTWTPTEIENTGLCGQVILEGDEFPSNDISNYNYLRVNSGAQLNVIILNTDNNSHYLHPETGASLNCEESIKENLDMNGIEYTVVTNLPDDLSMYDIVFVELGLWCVG